MKRNAETVVWLHSRGMTKNSALKRWKQNKPKLVFAEFDDYLIFHTHHDQLKPGITLFCVYMQLTRTAQN